jgi:electron transfer flavoprotein beta subunit
VKNGGSFSLSIESDHPAVNKYITNVRFFIAMANFYGYRETNHRNEETMAFSILVCIKAVPDLSSGQKLTIDDDRIVQADIAWCMNSYDACALEAALAIKDAQPQITVEVLSAGPEVVRPIIRRAMAMGADAGIHLPLETDECTSSETVAATIAQYTEGKSYDLILVGAISEDLMQGITGPMIAAALDRPCAAAAMAIDLDCSRKSIDVSCEMEGGMSERIRLALPALVTVQTGGWQPRYPTLSNTLRSRKETIQRVEAKRGKADANAIRTLGLAPPPPASACRIIEGTPAEKADMLLSLFNEKGWLK